MEQLITFIANHQMLVMAFLVIAGLLVWNFISDSLQGIKNLVPFEATFLINHEDALIIDVREEGEYKQQGHILNSMNIPSSTLSDKIGRLEKYRDHPIIISCLSGSRSTQAYKILKDNGFNKIFNLKGGIIAWQNANLPLVKGKE